jgi:hypothetical protein
MLLLRLPFLAGEDTRANLNKSREHIEDKYRFPLGPAARSKAAAIQFFCDFGKRHVLHNTVKHVNEHLGLGGVLDKVQAIVAHAQTVWDFFAGVILFPQGFFNLPFPLDGHEFPSSLSPPLEVLRLQRFAQDFPNTFQFSHGSSFR